MSANTKISWSDRTWNPLLGCERVSPGCDLCYAIQTATVRAGNPHPAVKAAFAGLTERDADGRLDWTGRINLLPDRLDQPLHWRKPSRVFVNSQADLFHKDVPTEFIAEVFAVMALARRHSFQLLTKRHARMRALLNSQDFRRAVGIAIVRHGDAGPAWRYDEQRNAAPAVWPLANLWLGVSVESQRWADIRIPALLGTPAAVRWLSCEPLLGPLDISGYLTSEGDCATCDGTGSIPVPGGGATCPTCDYDRRRSAGPSLISWVVCGGESGGGARPMHPSWPRSLRDQCSAAGVAFHFKQWGAWHPTGHYEWFANKRCQVIAPDGQALGQPWKDVEKVGTAVREGCAVMSRVAVAVAGRELDGVVHDAYPQVTGVSA